MSLMRSEVLIPPFSSSQLFHHFTNTSPHASINFLNLLFLIALRSRLLRAELEKRTGFIFPPPLGQPASFINFLATAFLFSLSQSY